MVIGEALTRAADLLRDAGAESPRLDAQVLMARLLGVDRLYLYTHKSEELRDPEGFWALVRRRAAREPVQYIVGRCEFMSHEFEVTPDVLIPRPDTETLVEAAAGHLNAWNSGLTRVLEVGTGSGCIAVSLARLCPHIAVDAVDVSPGAAAVAARNAARIGAENVRVFVHDIRAGLPENRYDALVSNPPYIERAVIPTLMEEVRGFEPHIALDGGADGLLFYRRIIELAARVPYIALEVGAGQAPAVAALLTAANRREIKVFKDLAGIERVVTAL
ncbi:release factor glutamine methyltransferase [Clostridia bacterium]|nr:release factor glutamine methyltransferase [Clostridia bacterium]